MIIRNRSGSLHRCFHGLLNRLLDRARALIRAAGRQRLNGGELFFEQHTYHRQRQQQTR